MNTEEFTAWALLVGAKGYEDMGTDVRWVSWQPERLFEVRIERGLIPKGQVYIYNPNTFGWSKSTLSPLSELCLLIQARFDL